MSSAKSVRRMLKGVEEELDKGTLRTAAAAAASSSSGSKKSSKKSTGGKAVTKKEQPKKRKRRAPRMSLLEAARKEEKIMSSQKVQNMVSLMTYQGKGGTADELGRQAVMKKAMKAMQQLQDKM